MKKNIFYLFMALFLIITNGCDEKPLPKAKVVDSTVEGIEYQCSSIEGFTKKDGEFQCYHAPIGFRVGHISLGIVYDIPEDHIFFPQDIVGVSRDKLNDENVKKVIVLLQSVDEDNNPENGITITKETREKLDDYIDIDKISLAELKDYLEAKLGKSLVNEKDAIKHLYRSMKKYNAQPRGFDINSLE